MLFFPTCQAGGRNEHLRACLHCLSDRPEVLRRNLRHFEKKMTAVEALRQAQLAVYLNPQYIKEWSKGRGPRTDVVREGSGAPKGEKAPLKQWAAFVVSGAGQ